MMTTQNPRRRGAGRRRSLPGRSGGRSLLVAGLMSGTSADGIDAALLRFTPGRGGLGMRILGFRTIPYPGGFRRLLLKNSDPRTARLDEISGLNILVAGLFSDAVRDLVSSLGFRIRDLALIGSHGQTIGHYPAGTKLFGRTIRSTLQVGDPALIAKNTGVPTVGNFRTGDIALGGSGAPLVPLFDYLVFSSRRVNRGILNIGGIANITILPKGAPARRVTAFDTGPGNMTIDFVMLKYFGKRFDRAGATARRGRIIPGLLRTLADHPYLRTAPPKSTGREMFGEDFVNRALRDARRARAEDIVATFTEFTALSVYLNCLRHVPRKNRPGELIVSGGGAYNPVIMDALGRYFAPAPVVPSDRYGIPADAKEAVCFALLAHRTVHGLPGNLPSVTGAWRPGLLGVICPP
ncbi:MAG TPA: anhydro-N-acetylmuramic acid kinase [Bacteroidota bacterium]|nr:anhydro-N-acetylmuramic acid kinase [Bacteroidota bacterium]